MYIVITFIINRYSFSIFPQYIKFSFIIFLSLIVGLAVKGVMPWKKSAEGEEEVYKELVRLPQEYIFLADFHKNKRKNVDFVVIGHTGIFAIESKNTQKGTVTSDNNGIYINGSPFEQKDPLKQAYEGGVEVQNFLKDVLNLSVPVTPVLVFANPGVETSFCKEKKKDVFVVEISCLASFLQDGHRDEKLTPEVCLKIKKEMYKYCSDIV